jgi:hypothetical protein
MTVYRYKYTGVTSSSLSNEVPGAVTTGVDAPTLYQDITLTSGSQVDLDEAMLARGWVYDSTAPTTTVEQAAATKIAATRKLLDFIGAPAESYATGAYRSITPGTVAPSNITWWVDNTATVKIFEANYTRNAAHAATVIQWKVYDASGTTVLTTVTDTVTYTGVTETSRTRTIV